MGSSDSPKKGADIMEEIERESPEGEKPEGLPSEIRTGDKFCITRAMPNFSLKAGDVLTVAEIEDPQSQFVRLLIGKSRSFLIDRNILLSLTTRLEAGNLN